MVIGEPCFWLGLFGVGCVRFQSKNQGHLSTIINLL